MKPRVIRVRETIIELLPNGWLNAKTGRTYRTAIGAQRALEREAKQIAAEHPDIAYVQIVEWHPKTSAGTAVVRVITNNYKPSDELGDN